MQHSEDHFAGLGGVELYRQQWLPDAEPRATVVLVHGVGEHSGRYERLVGPLTDAGYAVYAYDHRGHGRSSGPRVHIDRWEQYRSDLATHLAYVAEQAPGSPTVLYGHSMGSLVVLDYLLDRRDGLAGAVISGAALEPAGVGSPALIRIARVLSKITPRFSMSLGIDPTSLTRDPEALAAYAADELIEPRATMRWGTESLDTVERIKRGMHTIDLPMLVVHGGADPLNMPAGAQALYAALPNPDKTLHVYPDVHHEPHNDLDHEQVAADVTAWLQHVVE